MSRKSNEARRPFFGCSIFLIVVILLLIAGTAYTAWLCYDFVNRSADTDIRQEQNIQLPTAVTTEPTTEATTEPPPPEPEKVIATATIGTTGDVLMHMPVIDTGRQSDGSYDFESIFRYLEPYSSQVDFAAANLETTLAGTDNGYPYHGYPNFNAPDAIVTAARDAGFDMFLTANNHSYDTGIVGYRRTLEVVREAGMETLGTMSTAEEPKYLVQDINGIKIGMLCYTYAYSVNAQGCPSLNGMPHISEPGLCNYFHKDNLEAFYDEVETYLGEMEQAGAEATVMYIHWGVEYQTYANDEQKTIAQRLCDLGIDVIIGGHPHVVQPVDLIQSTQDPDHKTVCLYSMGNAVSNQRQGNISYINTAHTEDGVWFTVTFEKYSDGTVYLAGTELIPTWVNMHTGNGKKEYNILPLDPETQDDWKSLYNMNDTNMNNALKSYDRTLAIVGGGMEKVQSYLQQKKLDRDAYYLDLVTNPDKYDENGVLIVTPTQAPTEETVSE